MMCAFVNGTYTTCCPTPCLARVQMRPVRKIPNAADIARNVSSHPRLRVNASRVYSRPSMIAVAQNVVTIVPIISPVEREFTIEPKLPPPGGGGGCEGGGGGEVDIFSCPTTFHFCMRNVLRFMRRFLLDAHASLFVAEQTFVLGALGTLAWVSILQAP